MRTIASGEYWRLLTPGQYEVSATKTGYDPVTKLVKVSPTAHQEAFRVDFALQPSNDFDPQSFYSYNPYDVSENGVDISNPDVARLVDYIQRTKDARVPQPIRADLDV